MTYKKAEKIKIGDSVSSKDGYTFTVDKIKKENNAANTKKYIVFCGKTTSSINVHYNHKQII